MNSGKLLKLISAPIALFVSMHSFGQANDSLTYTEDILPIFTSTCLDCHGPDEARRMLNLRLDTQDFLTSHLSLIHI